MLQPYIKSATALSDCYIDDEEIARYPIFVGRQKWTSTTLLDPKCECRLDI